MLRTVRAPNASPLTLDGTRTHIVGTRRVVVIDPGSADPQHLDAVAGLIGDGVLVAVLVTHHHPDHADGAVELAARCDSTVRAHARKNLRDEDRIETDAGELIALHTPGHTADHVGLDWPAERAVFCGDLMMGGSDTALVAPPDGRLGPYLASLARIRALAPRVIHPAHGPAIEDADAAIERYVAHRELRLRQVTDALERGFRSDGELLEAVYGDALDPALQPAALAALGAYLEHLQGLGRIRRLGQGWAVVDSN